MRENTWPPFCGTSANSIAHLGLFCLHRENSSKNEIIKITPNTPKNESGLTQLIMMGESIRQIWVIESFSPVFTPGVGLVGLP